MPHPVNKMMRRNEAVHGFTRGMGFGHEIVEVLDQHCIEVMGGH
jgi:hypothetical protein